VEDTVIFAIFVMLGVIFACADDPRWHVAAAVCFVAAAIASNQPIEEDDDPPL